MINQIKVSQSINKDIDIIRRGINIQFNAIQDNLALQSNKPIIPVGTVKKNPYIGWIIMPNPDGNTKPFYSEYHGFTMFEITNPKPPFQKVVIKEGSEWYDYFINNN